MVIAIDVRKVHPERVTASAEFWQGMVWNGQDRNAAGALQEGVISPNRFLDAPGRIVIPNRFAPNDPGRSQEFVCWIYQTPEGSHGPMNMFTAMANSCDIYFYKIAGGYNQDGEVVQGLGIDRFYDYATQFGFGRLQGIELPIEAPGNMPTSQWKAINYGEPWSTGDDYNAAIGQGFDQGLRHLA